MPLPKACLFIDGSNFYHALKQSGFYDQSRYGDFYTELTKRFDIQKTFYYDAIKNRMLEPQAYARQQGFHARLEKEIPNVTIRSRKLRYVANHQNVENARQDADFCAACAPKLDVFLHEAGLVKLTKEKGIDILLVSDMVKGAFQERYQTALLATGDADFVPAVELVQSLKKEVINLHFYAGSASELRSACNQHLLIEADARSQIHIK